MININLCFLYTPQSRYPSLRFLILTVLFLISQWPTFFILENRKWIHGRYNIENLSKTKTELFCYLFIVLVWWQYIYRTNKDRAIVFMFYSRPLKKLILASTTWMLVFVSLNFVDWIKRVSSIGENSKAGGRQH